jgi:hypothetical protein
MIKLTRRREGEIDEGGGFEGKGLGIIKGDGFEREGLKGFVLGFSLTKETFRFHSGT